jgi:arabinoxylan arabinofuranohydrolase
MKKKNIKYGIVAFLVILSSNVFSQNPIATGFADPAMRVFNGKMYMVIGRDKGPETKNFQMPYWSIISSSDLRNWKVECYIDPKDTYLGAGYMSCWAADIALKNGKYYFYFSNGGKETGVLVADKISGPFIDVLKKPMIEESYSTNHEYDPTAFVDDDGQHYLTFGRDGQLKDELLHYQIAKLKDDMVSFDGKSKDLITTNLYGFGEKNRARDHSYFHKYNGTYYLSCAGVYMSSKSIYGPFTNERKTGQNTGHASFIEYNGQTYHAWEWTCDPFNNRVYRQVMMTYLHYKDNGDMVDDMNFIQGSKYYANGVGSYSAKWDTIQVEWYFKKSDKILKKELPMGGFEIQNLSNGAEIYFPVVRDLSENSTINFSLSAKSNGGKIEIYENDPTGKLLGTADITNTGSFKTYKTVATKLVNKAGTSNLCFVFKGSGDDLAHLDYFNFIK